MQVADSDLEFHYECSLNQFSVLASVAMTSDISGYIAVTCFFLFAGIGGFAQVYKLITRTREWRNESLDRSRVCEGLHPVREMWGFTAFLLFAASGLTRTYVDYFLIFSRIPVIALSTIILWFLQYHGEKDAKKFFLFALTGDLALAMLMLLTISGYRFDQSSIPSVINIMLCGVSLLLFYGKQLQAITMYRERRSRAVSLVREAGLVIKDVTGLWYAVTVGNELLWVGMTHVLSAVSSTAICVSKILIERSTVSKERSN